MTYVLSDIHGYYDFFIRMLEKIHFSSKDTLYILGDIIDRGPEVGKVIDKVISMENVKMLLGNHENMMVEFYKNTRNIENLYIWLRNGAEPTIKDFKRFSKEKQKSILEYFDSLPYKLEVNIHGQSFILVHGYYVANETGLSKESIIFKTVWNRYSKEDLGPQKNIVIFGHTPTKHYQDDINGKFAIWEHGNLFGIDCGLAGYKRYPDKAQLGCLCLETLEEFYID